MRALFQWMVVAAVAAGCSSAADLPADGAGGGSDGGGGGTKVCEPACSEWRQCVDGTCRLAANRCDGDQDCTTGVCSTQTHTCATDFCNPACAEWQVCKGRECSLAPGRCTADGDCPAATPQCALGTHRCQAPPVDPPLNIARWPGLVVTTQALRAPFEKLALVHTLTGLPTKVVTVEEICAGGCSATDPKRDTAKAIKDYLKSKVSSGLELVVLGGDIAEVPSRIVYDGYSNAIYGVEFEGYFFTDYYYADLSEWDGNHDGDYADDTADAPDYRPELGVTRIPASSAAQATQYVNRAVAHLTAYSLSSIPKALLLSNVATTLVVPTWMPLVGGYEIDVDSAHYFAMTGRTLDLLPQAWAKKQIYSDPNAAMAMNADVLDANCANEKAELEAGHNIVVHSGHGAEDYMTVEVNGAKGFSGSMARSLRNTKYPLFLSCACLAGTFAENDSAGEEFINAPSGGGIGYLGNTAVGLGIAGGMQLIDEYLRYTFADHSFEDPPRPLMGKALKTAHQQFKSSDGFNASELLGSLMPGWLPDFQIPTVDVDSYEWTQKTVVFFGDGLLPIWTDPTIDPAPSVSVTRQKIGNFSKLVFTVTPATPGVVTVRIDGDVRAVAIESGSTGSLVVPGAPAKLSWGFASDTSLYAVGEKTF